uniref:Chemokine interleukin-8-like domain-containing protein n=2 Tax=Hylobatidae TaxID=9577 RepID=A0A2I3GC90_NOMLE
MGRYVDAKALVKPTIAPDLVSASPPSRLALAIIGLSLSSFPLGAVGVVQPSTAAAHRPYPCDSISPSSRAAYKEKERWLQTSEGHRQHRVVSPFLALPTLEPRFHHLLRIIQVSTAALAVLLCTVALCNQVFSVPLAADTPTACCFSYISRQIPQNFIADYFETSSQCSKPSVIFLTKRGRQVHADPSEEWVQKYISDLELSA